MANPLAKRISSGEKIIAPLEDKTSEMVDTSKNDESVTYTSSWVKIGNKRVRTTLRNTKTLIKGPDGKFMPIFRRFTSIEIMSSNNELTIFQVTQGTGLGSPVYKRYKPDQIKLSNKLAELLGMPFPKIFTIFNKPTNEIYQMIQNNELPALRSLRIPDIKKFKEILQRPESKPKFEFTKEIQTILNITQESASKLASIYLTQVPDISDIDIELKPELDAKEKYELDASKLSAFAEMHREIIDEIQKTTSDIEKDELYAQGIGIERKLKNKIELDDSVENYHHPVRTTAPWIAHKETTPKIMQKELDPKAPIIEPEPKSKQQTLTADDIIDYARRRGITLSRDEAERKLEKILAMDPEKLPAFHSDDVKKLINLVEEILRKSAKISTFI